MSFEGSITKAYHEPTAQVSLKAAKPHIRYLGYIKQYSQTLYCSRINVGHVHANGFLKSSPSVSQHC